jgi:hypothetical protein
MSFEPGTEAAGAAAALRRFAATFDVADLPPDDVLERLWREDPAFKDWYERSPEMGPVHSALRQMAGGATQCSQPPDNARHEAGGR